MSSFHFSELPDPPWLNQVVKPCGLYVLVLGWGKSISRQYLLNFCGSLHWTWVTGSSSLPSSLHKDWEGGQLPRLLLPASEQKQTTTAFYWLVSALCSRWGWAWAARSSRNKCASRWWPCGVMTGGSPPSLSTSCHVAQLCPRLVPCTLGLSAHICSEELLPRVRFR